MRFKTCKALQCLYNPLSRMTTTSKTTASPALAPVRRIDKRQNRPRRPLKKMHENEGVPMSRDVLSMVPLATPGPGAVKFLERSQDVGISPAAMLHLRLHVQVTSKRVFVRKNKWGLLRVMDSDGVEGRVAYHSENFLLRASITQKDVFEPKSVICNVQVIRPAVCSPQ
jgi:hypothetical protein